MFLEKGRAIPLGKMGTIRHAAGSRVVADAVELALTRLERRRGLLGRETLDPGHGLLIAPCSSIHTWFMRFPIDVIFLRRDGLIVKTRAAIPAWRLAFGGSAYATLELPAGAIAEAGVKRGDRLDLIV